MDYKLAKQLQDAGFPIDRNWMVKDPQAITDIFLPELAPTLSELIEACGRDFQILCCDVHNFEREDKKWFAGEDDCGDNSPILRQMYEPHGLGKTPEEAVARLWLRLNTSKV